MVPCATRWYLADEHCLQCLPKKLIKLQDVIACICCTEAAWQLNTSECCVLARAHPLDPWTLPHENCDSKLGCTAGKASISLIFEQDWRTNSWRSTCSQRVSSWFGELGVVRVLRASDEPVALGWERDLMGKAVDENVLHIKCRWCSLRLPGSSHSSVRVIGSVWLYFNKTWWKRWGRWCQLNASLGVTKKVLEIIQRECSFAARFYFHFSIYVDKISLIFAFLCLHIQSSAI